MLDFPANIFFWKIYLIQHPFLTSVHKALTKHECMLGCFKNSCLFFQHDSKFFKKQVFGGHSNKHVFLLILSGLQLHLSLNAHYEILIWNGL